MYKRQQHEQIASGRAVPEPKRTRTPKPTTSTTTTSATTSSTTTSSTTTSSTTTSTSTTSTSTTTTATPAAGTAPIPVAAGSAWRPRLDGAQLDPNSAAMVAYLTAAVVNHWNGVAAFNNTQYDASFYPVPAGHPRRDVAFVDCQHKGYVDANLYAGPAYFRGVPIPDDAQPAAGTDAELSIYDAATDQVWEFWQARRNPTTGGWEACWGGRIDNVSTSMGVFPQWYLSLIHI